MCNVTMCFPATHTHTHTHTYIYIKIIKGANTFPGTLGVLKTWFKPFNTERDTLMQGFQLEISDLVIAGSVFHAISNLGRTIKNIQKLLKPGGRLSHLEPIAPEKVSTNFTSGTLPGWWLSTEEERSMGPAIEESAWDQVLRDNGFSGNDLILRDYQTEICHLFSIVVFTAAGSFPSSSQRIDIFLVTNGHISNQISLVQSLQSIFESTNKNK